MIKIYYPDGTHCYRPLHTVHAVYTDESGTLVMRAETADRSGLKTFEIAGFEPCAPGIRYD